MGYFHIVVYFNYDIGIYSYDIGILCGQKDAIITTPPFGKQRFKEIARLASQPQAKHLAPKPFCDGNLNVPFAIAPACKARVHSHAICAPCKPLIFYF